MQQLTTAIRANVPLGFGLLNVSVSIHAAVGEAESAGLRTVCTHDHDATPIRQTQSCPQCGNADRATFGRAHEGDGAVFTVIPSEVLEEAKAAATQFKGALNLTVHPAAQVSAQLLPSGKAYYLSMKNPNKGSLEAYAHLVMLVTSRPDLAFMTKMTLSTATSLFQLAVAGESTLMLRQMADAELIRQHPVLDLPDIDPQAVKLASMLADQKTEPFVVAEHGTVSNTIIADYVSAQATTATVTAGAGGTVTDLTAALAASVKAGQKPVRKPRAPRRPAAAKAS